MARKHMSHKAYGGFDVDGGVPEDWMQLAWVVKRCIAKIV